MLEHSSLNVLLAGPMEKNIPDPYAPCEQLRDWDLYAVDVHYHHAACIDYHLWFKLKHTYGIYLNTLEKRIAPIC